MTSLSPQRQASAAGDPLPTPVAPLTQFELDQRHARRNREWVRRMEARSSPAPVTEPAGGPDVEGLDLRDEFDIDYGAPPEDVPDWEDV